MIKFESIKTNWQSLLRRFIKLHVGLILIGFGMGLMVKSNLGCDPWTVFHLGVSNSFNIGISLFVQLSGALFLFIAWAFLRQPVGMGSIFNMILIGPWLEFFLALLPPAPSLSLALPQLFIGIIILAFSTALYITADFGAGPRDGLILGLSFRLGISIKHTRVLVELAIISLGYLLHGPLGVGTLIFALSLGPLMQFFLQHLRRRSVRKIKAMGKDI